MSKRKNPMWFVLSNPKDAINSANGVLSKLWAMIIDDQGINGAQWDRLLDGWRKRNEAVLGRSEAAAKKSNLAKALGAPTMTWNVFYSGLQILNSNNRFKKIRFEIHLVPKRGPTEIIGLDVINREVHRHEDPYTQYAREAGIKTLKPGERATPGERYIVEEFDNERFRGIVLEYTGTVGRSFTSDAFNGYSVCESLVLDDTGAPSNHWIRIIGEVPS